MIKTLFFSCDFFLYFCFNRKQLKIYMQAEMLYRYMNLVGRVQGKNSLHMIKKGIWQKSKFLWMKPMTSFFIDFCSKFNRNQLRVTDSSMDHLQECVLENGDAANG
eukprot:TRINITY_DN3287_c2_g1_i1.p1 TRINITY_DN3287_c2_g1~~TRINITY_DN3287_c2_g1_i1.p1  ORF type:complete len:106 (-),score=2.20 TRINITY_DN3287_c2_g1_i1:58-375(-)